MEMSGEILPSVKMETRANTATLAQSSSSIQRYSNLLWQFGSWLEKQMNPWFMWYIHVPAGRMSVLLAVWSWDTEGINTHKLVLQATKLLDRACADHSCILAESIIKTLS